MYIVGFIISIVNAYNCLTWKGSKEFYKVYRVMASYDHTPLYQISSLALESLLEYKSCYKIYREEK